MVVWLSVTALLAAAGRPAAPRPPTAHAKPLTAQARPAAGDFSLSVSPATITFTATNPDSAPVDLGNAGAWVSWQSRVGKAGSWSLTVQAGSPGFSNCPAIPISAVTVFCASAATNTGRSGNCSPPFALSTSPQVVARGNQGTTTFSYAVTLSFTLADNWKYTAETSPSCSLSLSYAATVP
jgi:hypothetical protein